MFSMPRLLPAKTEASWNSVNANARPSPRRPVLEEARGRLGATPERSDANQETASGFGQILTPRA